MNQRILNLFLFVGVVLGADAAGGEPRPEAPDVPASPGPAAVSTGAVSPMGSGATAAVGRYRVTLYGFAEADAIHDSTRSFVDLAGMAPIARPGTPNGDLGRTMFSVRDSRLGLRLTGPDAEGPRVGGRFEMDFLGNQPAPPPKPNGSSEGPFFNNATFRLRYSLLEIEQGPLSVWAGQYRQLIGWQETYRANTVSIQGVPGELYGSAPQLRLRGAFRSGPTVLHVAFAVLRPPQMDSEVPDLQGGVRWSLEGWKGVQSEGATTTRIANASVGLSGAWRRYGLPGGAGGNALRHVDGGAVAANLLVPILPADHRRAWALTLLAEGVQGAGDADLYTGLSGGAGAGAPPGYPGGSTAYARVADVDPGLVGWSNRSGAIEPVRWKSLLLSLQWYLPPGGDLWLAAGLSTMVSDNVAEFGLPAALFDRETWWDFNLFADVYASVRLGLEYARFSQRYVDGVWARNDRFQLSTFYLF